MQQLSNPQYRDWLNLSFHLLWCYDHKLGMDSKYKNIINPAPASSKTYFVNNAGWLVREGWAEVRHDNKVLRAYPGQWLIVKPGPRIQKFAENTRLLVVTFDARWPDGTNWLEDGLSTTLEAVRYPELERLARPMARITKTMTPGWYIFEHRINRDDFFALHANLARWLRALAAALSENGIETSRRGGIDENALRGLRLLQSLPLDQQLDREKFARDIGLSPVHLTRIFLKHIGTTPSDYHNHRRLEHARRRLSIPGVRIKDVANELGFAHLSHFSTWFKKNEKISPASFKSK
jgi:AraC-like DNA-binding protein